MYDGDDEIAMRDGKIIRVPLQSSRAADYQLQAVFGDESRRWWVEQSSADHTPDVRLHFGDVTIYRADLVFDRSTLVLDERGGAVVAWVEFVARHDD